MDEIFADMTDEGIVIIYMDDVFIFAPDEIMLTENTKRVLAQLQENDLFLKPAKCEFNKAYACISTCIRRDFTIYDAACACQKTQITKLIATVIHRISSPESLKGKGGYCYHFLLFDHIKHLFLTQAAHHAFTML